MWLADSVEFQIFLSFLVFIYKCIYIVIMFLNLVNSKKSFKNSSIFEKSFVNLKMIILGFISFKNELLCL